MIDPSRAASTPRKAQGDDEDGAPPISVDRTGDLSIVVQGGLFQADVVETANNVRHWRGLFPNAQIVLSLSGSDLLLLDVGSGGSLTEADLAPPHSHNVIVRAAWRAITAACDVVVLAPDALPLPPIKSDTARPNHVNLQIAAARAGLDQANGRYVLRVRSDLIFKSRVFVEQYRRDHDLARGDRAWLRQRVMISWLYTLNPYDGERLPLHFSDWFHFGLAGDVRKLWDVEDMRYSDATFFLAEDFPSESGFQERLFNTRLAVEQHLTLQAFRDELKDVSLKHFNDISSRALSLNILADNYVLCDLRAAGMIFPKYQDELFNDRKLHACITPDMWRRLVEMRFVDPKLVVMGDTDASADIEQLELRSGFPRHYAASDLASGHANVRRGVLCSEDAGGTLFVSRGIRLPPGRFRASLNVVAIRGHGIVTLKLLPEDGGEPLTTATIRVEEGRAGDADLLFGIEHPYGPRVRLACETKGVRLLAVSGFAIDRADPREEDLPLPRMLSLDRVVERDGTGCLAGQVALGPGRYVAALNLAPSPERPVLRVMGGGGVTQADETCWPADPSTEGIVVPFDVANVLDRPVELLVEASGTVRSHPTVLIAARGDETLDTPFPRFYDVLRLRTGQSRFEDREIVATATTGLVCYGPHISLPAGGYSAAISISRMSGGGRLTITVTCDAGARVLGRGTISLPKDRPVDAAVPFDVDQEAVHMVEIVCRIANVTRFAVSGVMVRRRASGPPNGDGKNVAGAAAGLEGAQEKARFSLRAKFPNRAKARS